MRIPLKEIKNTSGNFDTNTQLLASVFDWYKNRPLHVKGKVTYGNLASLLIYGTFDLNWIFKNIDEELVILPIVNVMEYYHNINQDNMYINDINDMEQHYKQLEKLIIVCKKYFNFKPNKRPRLD